MIMMIQIVKSNSHDYDDSNSQMIMMIQIVNDYDDSNSQMIMMIQIVK